MQYIDICGIPFRVQDYESAIELFDQWIASGKSHQVCVANVHTIVSSRHDEKLRNINLQADMVTMDGQPLRWYANLVHHAGLKDRVCGPELMLRCLAAGQSKGWKHYFYGGTPQVLEKLVANMRTAFPQIEITGAYSPPYRPLSPQEDAEVIERINASRPDFLWVGLGAPKQEYWISDHLNKVNVPVQLGVGAAFDFHAKAINRAPELMQRLGLEWCYRIWKDPRLWKRYMTTNPVFLYMLIRDWLKSRFQN